MIDGPAAVCVQLQKNVTQDNMCPVNSAAFGQCKKPADLCEGRSTPARAQLSATVLYRVTRVLSCPFCDAAVTKKRDG